MHAAIVFSAVTLIQGVLGYAHGGAFPAIPAVMRGADSLVKRQEVCDAESGLSCRAGEYCVVINGALGCCPEGKVCDSVRTCTDHSNPGCKNGGTVGGSLCCGANTPYCNSIGYTDYCDTVPPPAITKTATLTTTVCPHSNYTVTPSCPSPPANHTTPCASAPANHTTTYILPTLAPYPSDEESEATPTPTYIAHTSIYVSTSTNRTTSVPKPTVPPIQTGGGDTINVSFSVAMGGCAVALLGAFLG